MKTVILIRHAETAMAGRFCGHSDPDLNAAGLAQLPRIVRQVGLSRIDRMLCSDLHRARQTALAIARKFEISVELRPTLREIHFGLWEGLRWSEIEARFPHEAEAWLHDFPARAAPKGESYAEFLERIDGEFLSLLAGEVDERLVVVTHRGVMRSALTRFFGFSEQEAFDRTALYGAVVSVVCPSAGRLGAGNGFEIRLHSDFCRSAADGNPHSMRRGMICQRTEEGR
ncbi:MAG TPA: histidine phosphatase family protein [Acidobacteriaceae bacterium]|jgi:broad specificity phosphatase PhoE|nr:histidine phosphatase family protein [Acidobacteriaceae bacterium]